MQTRGMPQNHYPFPPDAPPFDLDDIEDLDDEEDDAPIEDEDRFDDEDDDPED